MSGKTSSSSASASAAANLAELHQRVLSERQQAMEELGLTSSDSRWRDLAGQAQQAKSRKRRREEPGEEDLPSEPVRRSGRLASMPVVNFNVRGFGREFSLTSELILC
jgi:hypothetical protein